MQLENFPLSLKSKSLLRISMLLYKRKSAFQRKRKSWVKNNVIATSISQKEITDRQATRSNMCDEKDWHRHLMTVMVITTSSLKDDKHTPYPKYEPSERAISQTHSINLSSLALIQELTLLPATPLDTQLNSSSSPIFTMVMHLLHTFDLKACSDETLLLAENSQQTENDGDAGV